MHFVYAISSTIRNYTYIGLTSDIKKRLFRHNNGREKTTRSYAPFILIYFEVLEDREKARVREKYLKTSQGRQYLKDLPSSKMPMWRNW